MALSILVMILLSSCGGAYKQARMDRKCQRHINKAISGGCLDTNRHRTVTKDTTHPEVRDTGSVKIQIDSSEINRLKEKIRSLRNSSIPESAVDSLIESIIDSLKHSIRIRPISAGDSTYALDIWIDNGVIKWNLNIAPRVDTKIHDTGPVIHPPKPKCPDCNTGKLWTTIFLLFGSLLLVVILMMILAIKMYKSSR